MRDYEEATDTKGDKRQGGVNITLVTPIAHDTPPYDEHIVDNMTYVFELMFMIISLIG